MYAVLFRKSIEGQTTVERSPFWIPEENIQFLSTPKDNCDEEYFWEFFQDRMHLTDAGLFNV